MIKARRKRKVTSQRLSGFLQDLRAKQNLTLMDIQERSKRYEEKVNFDYLSRVERGILLPSLPKLLTLARIYKISPAIFFDLIEIGQHEKLKPAIDDYKECKAYGIRCAEHGDLDKAIGAFGRCVEIISKEKEIRKKGKLMSEIFLCSGIALRQMGKLSLAKEDLEKAIKNRTISVSMKMRVLNELANVYIDQDNLFLAELCVDEALKLARREDDLSIVATANCTKANGLVRAGSFEEADLCYREAIKIYEKRKDVPNLITTSNNIGNCLVKMGKPEESVPILEKSRLLAEKEGTKRSHTIALINLGDAYRLMKKRDKAKLFLMEASTIAREYEYVKSIFLSAFYLWKIAREEKDERNEQEYFLTLKFYRTKVQETFEELKEFDSFFGTARDAGLYGG